MTPALRDHLLALTDRQRATMRRDSIDCLRDAWPHRHNIRGRTVVTANAKMLRNLRAL